MSYFVSDSAARSELDKPAAARVYTGYTHQKEPAMVKARKVGNSVTVTIPKDVVIEMGITEDMDMNVFVREGVVVMEPAVSRWDRLVSRVRIQAAQMELSEADVDQAVGEIRSGRSGENPAPGDV